VQYFSFRDFSIWSSFSSFSRILVKSPWALGVLSAAVGCGD
jgi:hypothetical protein